MTGPHNTPPPGLLQAAEAHARTIFKIKADVADIGLRISTPDFHPRALLVVLHELPTPLQDPWEYGQLFAKYTRLEKALSSYLRREVHFESINSAVSGLYYV